MNGRFQHGTQMTQELKTDEATSHIPIILLTAKAENEHVLHGLEIGADDYIAKPFDSVELRLKVKNQVDTRKKFANQLVNHSSKAELKKLTFNSADKRFLEKLLNIVEEHMSDSTFNNTLLCDELGMRRAQLYRKVKALTGKSVHEYIRIVRLNEASKLLLDRGLNITEVMYKVGFNSHSYFTKCFKDQFGKIPSEYMHQTSV